MINTAGRAVPEEIDGYGKVIPYRGAFESIEVTMRAPVKLKAVKPGKSKRVDSVETVLHQLNIESGMTLSFHHHLRNGDSVLNQVMCAIEKMNVTDLTLAISSIFPVHDTLVEYMKKGIVTGLITNYMSGPVATAVSTGLLKKPAIMMTHGGRPRAIESGEVKIDIAFIAAPTADVYGNCNGIIGKSACGSLGYAVSDSLFADQVVVITDNLCEYPAMPIEINQSNVDYIIEVESIGNPQGIVSGTTQVTKDPIGLLIAEQAARVIKFSGFYKSGFSFQTGAGGISLAVASELKKMMKADGIVGGFASGGITGYLVNMLEEGYFKALLDVQSFDLEAIRSLKENANHIAMDASMYANPMNKGAVVNLLDFMILGATEIDLEFNVNVTTGSTGIIMGGSGGHSDTAAGSKVSIVVSKLVNARVSVVKRKVTTITTPGETIDVLVTDRGIAVNPKRVDLIQSLESAGVKLVTIETLLNLAEDLAGIPDPTVALDRIVAVVQYRDGTIIDVINQVKG